jgi:hypothetical protein
LSEVVFSELHTLNSLLQISVSEDQHDIWNFPWGSKYIVSKALYPFHDHSSPYANAPGFFLVMEILLPTEAQSLLLASLAGQNKFKGFTSEKTLLH